MKNTEVLSLTPPKRKDPAKLSAMMQTDDSLLREIREMKTLNQELSKQLASKMSEAVVFKSNSAKIEMTKIEEAS
jgi:IS4 transposase